RAERFRAERQSDEKKRRELLHAEQKVQRARLLELKHWWLQRMATGPRPLRRQSTRNWLKFLASVAQDPAMLVWLDQAQSRKQHPNENFAREVMELFTLGEGHYTEKDVSEAARALTGWSYDRLNQEFAHRPRLHDAGEKVFLGRKGDLTGED